MFDTDILISIDIDLLIIFGGSLYIIYPRKRGHALI